MDADTEREAYYKAFDAAVLTLPADYRKHACLGTSGVTAKGVVEIRDRDCNLIAQVQDTTRPYLVQPAAPTSPPAKPAPDMASKAFVEQIALKSIEVVTKVTAEKLKTLSAIVVQQNKRIAELEGSAVLKSLDVEAYDAMQGIAQRLDQIEANLQAVAERAVHYRGFWRSGTQAKRNESYTDGGQLWIAINTTTDRPSENSEDWRIAARKGRDAR